MFEKCKDYRTTLSSELIFVIVAALIAAVFMYFVLSAAANRYLDSHFTTDEYYQSEDAKIISSLKDYIREYTVSSDDRYVMDQWVEANPVSYIAVYKDGRLAYLSDAASTKEWSQLEHETGYEESVAYRVKFEDGNCDVIISGQYAVLYYNIANVLKIVIPCIFFFTMLILSIRHKVKYIVRLDQDVDALQRGEYDHDIHIEGHDELTTLAESIDEMRTAYNHQIEEINRMSDDSREFVTEMSHDMRTPMTPLLVYLGMLRDRRYETEEEYENYVLKANEKAVQLKHMIDNMFASLLVNQRAEIELTETNMNEAFYDQMSALADYLGTEGFQIDAANVRPCGERVRVNLDFLARIFDNIMSNILKYADQESPLHIYMHVETGAVGEEDVFSEDSGEKRKTAVIRFENKINELADYSSSTGFGVKNIHKMMEQMNGECMIDQQTETYSIELRFPVKEENPQPMPEEVEREPDKPSEGS